MQVGLIKWTERPSTWIEGPTCSTYRDLLARSTTMGFMHPWIKMSVKQEAEMCQTQADRPRRVRPAYQLSASNRRNPPPPSRQDQERPREGRRQMARIPAGRPRRGRPAPLCSVECSSSRGSYVNRLSCLHLTPRPITNL